VDRASAF